MLAISGKGIHWPFDPFHPEAFDDPPRQDLSPYVPFLRLLSSSMLQASQAVRLVCQLLLARPPLMAFPAVNGLASEFFKNAFRLNLPQRSSCYPFSPGAFRYWCHLYYGAMSQ